MKLDLTSAEQIREQLTFSQQKQIRKLYRDASKMIQEEIKHIPSTGSAYLKKQYLIGLKEQIDTELARISVRIKGTVTQNMTLVSEALVKANQEFLNSVGFSIHGAFSHVPSSVVESIVSGRVYEGNWSLDKALWKLTSKGQSDIQQIVAQGVAQNKTTYETAKDLEKYVNPSAKKDWSWSKVYPGTSKVVDYNAQRLARTMVSHAYQQSFIQTTQPNPFVTEYRWIASGARTCPICEERDGQLFDKDDLPMDHPNGMCTYEAVIPYSGVDIADRIADWALGGNDPELDDFNDFLEEKWS